MHPALITPINTLCHHQITPQHSNRHTEINVLHWRQILLHVKVQCIRQYVYAYESLKGFRIDNWLAKDFVP